MNMIVTITTNDKHVTLLNTLSCITFHPLTTLGACHCPHPTEQDTQSLEMNPE